MRIATGEEPEEFDGSDGKDPAAQAMGRKGGKARASALTPARRSAIAKKAAKSRWKER
jgi:hypothetical protein